MSPRVVCGGLPVLLLQVVLLWPQYALPHSPDHYCGPQAGWPSLANGYVQMRLSLMHASWTPRVSSNVEIDDRW